MQRQHHQNDGIADDDSSSSNLEASAPPPVSSSKSTKSNTADSTMKTPKSTKHKVTPMDDSGSKQKQQKKVSQMSLAAFLVPASKSSTSSPFKIDERKNTQSDNSSASGSEHDKNPALDDDSRGNKKSQAAQTLDTTAPEPAGNEETDASSDPETGSKSRFQKVECNVPPNKTSDSISTTLSSASSKDENQKNSDSKPKAARKRKAKKELQVAVDKTNDPTSTNNDEPKDTNCSKPKDSKKRKARKIEPAVADAANEEEDFPPKRLTEADLSAERSFLYQRYQAMKEQYLQRSLDLVAQSRDCLEEEKFEMEELQPLQEGESLDQDGEEFPARVVVNMALLIEGRYGKSCVGVSPFFSKMALF
jgi:hypothetical protein